MVRYAIVDDTDPRLVYTGDWRTGQTPINPKTPEYNGTVHYTNDPTATVTFSFNGRVVDVFGTIDAPATYGYPNASFVINPTDTGSSLKHMNETGAIPPIEDLTVATSHIELFKTGLMERGNYTMTLVTDGVREGGPTFYLDFLRVLPPDGIYIDLIPVDDNDEEWDYIGDWVPGNHTGDYLYSAHETPHEGGSAELKFYGSEISVYGTLNGKYNEDTPIAYINVAAGRMHTILAQDVTNQPLESGVPLRNQLIFSTSGLQDLGMDQRTLTISVPPIIATSTATVSTGPDASSSATPAPTISNPSWFLDYAIYGPYSANASSSLSPPGPTSSSPSSSSPSSPPPAGAIAGGVVGALAAVALIVVAFLLWRRRKQRLIPTANFKEGYPLSSNPTVTAYSYTESSSTPTTFAGRTRRSSTHKASQASAQDGSRTLNPGIQSPTSPGLTETGTATLRSINDQDTAHNSGNTIREVDGGVRLARGSDYGGAVNVLPPRYAEYDD